MLVRTALLIGVPEYDSDAIENLPTVRNDVDKLRTALESSEYAVRTVSFDHLLDTSKSKVLQAIRHECKWAKPNQLLLIYFGGHGVHSDGTSYLVPSDANVDDVEHITDYLISVDFMSEIERSPAACILFFIDACREGFDTTERATSLRIGWSEDRLRAVQSKMYAYVWACGTGAVSRHVRGPEGFGLFSRALAEVLSSDHSARTFAEVIASVQERTDALATEHKKERQLVQSPTHCDAHQALQELEISNSPVVDTASPSEADPWLLAATESPLWRTTDVVGHASTTSLQEQCRDLIAACSEKWHAAVQSIGDDPWRDHHYPCRVLARLAFLCLRSSPKVELSPVETALLVVAPFHREAVLADGVVACSSARPLSLAGEGTSVGVRASLERTHRSFPQLIRKAERLRDLGRKKDHDAVALWLMHRSLGASPETWFSATKGTSSSSLSGLLKAFDAARGTSETAPLGQRLVELARSIQADEESIDRIGSCDAELTVLAGTHAEQRVRPRVLAHLLLLAGRMAIDVRTLPSVLVDHVGLSDPLDPVEVVETVERASWIPVGTGRSLQVQCDHQAVDLSLTDHVDQLAAVVDMIHQKSHLNTDGLGVLSGLPTRLIAANVTASPGEDLLPKYQKPHLRFHISEGEVRELLMGEQLYQDPSLAIRELYQNALDACRYRQARTTFLLQTGHELPSWEGKIVFRQGMDRGREFIECEDNGIGMGRREVSAAFARAGSRFADMPEFVEEQAEWLRADPPIHLYPNSQFGIGVFSYFMLADELEIETTRMPKTGSGTTETLRIDVSGSGSLFRLRPVQRSSRDAGTRIRLYLSRTESREKRISCLNTLRELLYIAEYRTEVVDGTETDTWMPGELKIAKSHCVPTGNPDFYWARNRAGVLLADGLRTGNRRQCALINLRQAKRPKLSIDRAKALEFDADYVSRLYEEGVKDLLSGESWNWVTVEWLWALTKEHVCAADRVVKGLADRDRSIRLNNRGDFSTKRRYGLWPLRTLGCWLGDELLIHELQRESRDDDPYEFERSGPRFMLASRAAALGRWGLRIHGEAQREVDKLISTKSCPVPTPADAVLFASDLDVYRPVWFGSTVPMAQVLYASAKLGESIDETLCRLERYRQAGVKFPPRSSASFATTYVEDRDVELTTRRSSWNRNCDLVHPVALDIVAASLRWNEPIPKVLDRVVRLESAGVDVPCVNPEQLESLQLNMQDLVVASQMLNARPPWVDAVSFHHLLGVALEFREPLGSATKRARRLESLGIKLPDYDLDGVAGVPVTQRHIDLLSRISLSWPSPLNVISASQRLSSSIGKVVADLAPYAPLGLVLPERLPDELANYVAKSRDVELLRWTCSEQLDGKDPWFRGILDKSRIHEAAKKRRVSPKDAESWLRSLAPLGLHVED